jgi:hypothetical protein
MADANVRSQLNTLSDNISRILTVTIEPGLHEVYTDLAMMFTGRMKPNTVRMGGAGLRKDYKVQPARNGEALGALTSGMSFGHASSQAAFDNIIYTESHLQTVHTAGEYDALRIKMLENDEQALVNYLTMTTTDAIAGQASMEDTLSLTDRRNFIANVVQNVAVGDITDEAKSETIDGVAYTGRYVVTLQLGVLTSFPMLYIGRQLHIAGVDGDVAGAFFYTQTTLLNRVRNYGVPAVVVGFQKLQYRSPVGGTGYFAVQVAFPYTGVADATLKATVLTQIESILAGDVICPYGGATAATGTMPFSGPNYGGFGLRSWFSTANYNVPGSWCNVAMQTEYAGSTGIRAYASVDRTTSAYNYLVPYLDLGGTTATSRAFSLSMFDDLAFNVKSRNGGQPLDGNHMIIMNGFNIQAGIDEVGPTYFRQTAPVSDATAKKFQDYGFSGVSWQGIAGAGPIALAQTDVMPLDMILCLEPGKLERLEPMATEWLTNASGSIFHDVSDLSAYGATVPHSKVTARRECHRIGRFALHLNDAQKQAAMIAVRPK